MRILVLVSLLVVAAPVVEAQSALLPNELLTQRNHRLVGANVTSGSAQSSASSVDASKGYDIRKVDAAKQTTPRSELTPTTTSDELESWRATVRSADIAFLAFISAVVQVLLFAWQLSHMKSANDTASKAAIAAKTQSDAILRGERARVFVEVGYDIGKVEVGLEQERTYQLLVRFRNLGKTVAQIKQLRGYPVVQNGVPQQLLAHELGDAMLPDGLAIAAGEEYEMPIAGRMTAEQWEALALKNIRWFCCGKIIYEDIFGQVFETGYCWQYFDWKNAPPEFQFCREAEELNYKT
jgi:hypothetical protein